MAQRRVSKKYASIRDMVRDLEDLFDGEKWTLDTEACAAWKKRPWAGAGTVICEKPRKTPNPDHTYDVSPYIVELSWLFDYLKIRCSEFVRAPTACGRHAIRKPPSGPRQAREAGATGARVVHQSGNACGSAGDLPSWRPAPRAAARGDHLCP